MEVMKETLETYLHKVIKKNRQSIALYDEASTISNNAPMSMLFDRLRQQRLYFENILERIMEKNGSKVEEGTNLQVLARKVWLNVRTHLAYRNEDNILSEVKKAELELKESVETLLKEGSLEESDHKIISTQLKIISDDVRNIEKLRAEYAEKLNH